MTTQEKQGFGDGARKWTFSVDGRQVRVNAPANPDITKGIPVGLTKKLDCVCKAQLR